MHVCFVVFVLVFQYLAKRLAGKNVSLHRVGHKTLTQSIIHQCAYRLVGVGIYIL